MLLWFFRIRFRFVIVNGGRLLYLGSARRWVKPPLQHMDSSRHAYVGYLDDDAT